MQSDTKQAYFYYHKIDYLPIIACFLSLYQIIVMFNIMERP